MKVQKNKKRFKPIAITLLVLGVIAASAFLVWHMKTTQTNNTTTRPVNDVDYSGPSEEDIENSQDAKKRGEPSENSTTTPSDDPAKRSATLGIAFADKEGDFFEVRAFVTNVIEGNGVCTATLTNGNKSISRKTDAFIDASSSQCRPIAIPLSELTPSGTWSLVVTYESPTSKGATEPEAVAI